MLQEYDGYLAIIPEDITSERCAIFDFDGTLVTKANARPAYEAESISDNFVLLYGVKEAFEQLIENDIQIVILSNQSNLTTSKIKQFELFSSLFDNKIMFLIAHQKNEYRKPEIGFLKLLENFEILFMCGDAIGQDSEFPPFQWSDSDKQFALNAGIDFYSPIEIFESNYDSINPTEKVIIMMGNQGSGKTTLSKRLENTNRIRYSQDEYCGKLNTVKLKNEMKSQLRSGKSIILDATHSSAKNRQVWIKLAEEMGADYIILWCARDGRPFNALRAKPLKPVVYGTYSAHFDAPDDHFIVVS